MTVDAKHTNMVFVRVPVDRLKALDAHLRAAEVRVSIGYLPTVQTAWERVTGAKPLDWIDEPTLAAMVRDGVRPRTGTIVSVRIPADHSGFAHRDELVYLPPAWFASDPPPRLPAVMMIGAELSHPSDWPESGDALRILNEFARKHHGVTPISVFPDSTGTFTTGLVNPPTDTVRSCGPEESPMGTWKFT